MSHAEILAKHQVTQVTQSPNSANLVPCNFGLFPKLKSPLKGKKYQTIDEIQENATAGGDWEHCVRSQEACFDGDWENSVRFLGAYFEGD